MSRTAQTHDRENAPRQLQHAARGRHLLPRSVLRAASSMGPGSRATLSPVAQKGGTNRTRQMRRANGNTANRLALGRPIGESASY